MYDIETPFPTCVHHRIDSQRTRALVIGNAQGLGLQRPGCCPASRGSPIAMPALQQNAQCPRRGQELEISNPKLEASEASSPCPVSRRFRIFLTHSRSHHQFKEELGLEPKIGHFFSSLSSKSHF